MPDDSSTITSKIKYYDPSSDEEIPLTQEKFNQIESIGQLTGMFRKIVNEVSTWERDRIIRLYDYVFPSEGK